MNHTINDRGESVMAIGAPGSLARVRIEYPALIERLNALFNSGGKCDVAIDIIRKAGIRSEMETSHLLAASHFGERPDIATSLVYSVSRTDFRLFCDTYRRFLAKSRNDYPALYSWPVEELQVVGDRMIAAIERGSFNKDSHAIRWTCKELNIPHTYKAIKALIAT